MDKVWVIPSLDELLREIKDKPAKPQSFISAEKNPAKAYSWSAFFWGGGHIYNNQVKKGLSFLSLMVGFYTGILLTVLSWSGIVQFLQARGMPVSVFLLTALVLLLFGLIFRSLCCSDAYNRTTKTRRNRFTGTKSHAIPFLCSILTPGWGQFLNGQPIKGSILAGFSIVSFFSLITVPAVLLAWKDLEPSFARFLVESLFTISFLFLPIIPAIWIFGCHDALKISLEEWRKESLWDRIRDANNHRRNKVWVRRLFHRLKRTFALVLFLVFFLLMLHNFLPRQFYSNKLDSARCRLQTKGMVLLPELLNRLSLEVAANGNSHNP